MRCGPRLPRSILLSRGFLVATAVLLVSSCAGEPALPPADGSPPVDGSPPGAGGGRSELAAPVAERVDAVFSDFDATTPGCSAGVIRDGELVHARGYGMADLERGVPLGPDSVFRIGSTSKQFTAAAVLLLEQQRKLSRDDDVRRHLPELHDFGTPVTLRHLIHHTSGYRDYLTLMRLAGKRDMDWYDEVEVMEMLARQRDLNFDPGTEFLYSNSGYFLLSQVILRADGRSLREYAADEIFEPLGMERTHFHDDPTEIVPGRAMGYAPADRGEQPGEEEDSEAPTSEAPASEPADAGSGQLDAGVAPEERFVISMTALPMIGDGGVFTTVRDLARWDGNFYEPAVGGRELVEALQTPGTLDDGTLLDYAAGLRVGQHRGLRRVGHGGSFVGFRAQMVRFPDERVTVICLCNRADGDPSERAMQVARILLEDRMEPAEEAADESAEAAEAEADETETAETEADETEADQTEADQTETDAIETDAIEAADPSGVGAGETEAPVELSEAQLRRFAGRFHSGELGVDYQIRLGDDGVPRLSIGRLPERRLEPRATDVLADDRLRLRFQSGRDGRFSGFLLDAGRVRDLRFVRR